GVGEYSFAPWKVAISGFYKNFRFAVVGPHAGRPVVLDDTVYFIPCRTHEEAEYFGALLNSDRANKFFWSFCFFDSKRLSTTELLRPRDLLALARELGSAKTIQRYLEHQTSHRKSRKTPSLVPQSQLLFEN